MDQQPFYCKNEGGGLEYEWFIMKQKIPKNITQHQK